MDEARREEIMPLELAIQRELAYRQKIAMLSIKSANGSGLQLTPLQPGGLTSCSRVESHVAENERDRFFCNVCQVSSSSGITYEQHVKGHKHRANLRLPFKGNDDIAATTAMSSRKRCDLCNIWCMNELAFNQHLEGQKHKEKLHNLKPTGNNARNMVKKQRFW